MRNEGKNKGLFVVTNKVGILNCVPKAVSQ